MEAITVASSYETFKEREYKDEVCLFKHGSYFLDIYLLSLLGYLSRYVAVVLFGLYLQETVVDIKCGGELSAYRLEILNFFWSFIISLDFVVVWVSARATF